MSGGFVFNRQVQGVGPRNAKLVIVAEAPGQVEVERGTPLVGPTGQLLESWLGASGLHRSTIRLENVVEERPPGNKLQSMAEGALEAWTDDCRRRLRALSDADIVVPLGNLALNAVLGIKGITKWRGTIFRDVGIGSADAGSGTLSVIPSLHPAAIFRQPYWEARCRRDWQRISACLSQGIPERPSRRHDVIRDIQEAERWVDECECAITGDPNAALALDIETNGSVILCVGFAYSPLHSATFPTTPSACGGTAAASAIWMVVQRLCNLPVPKVLHNGLFDTYYLRRLHGIEVRNYTWDTLAMHHVLAPTEDHDLALLTSLDTLEPYYKDEHKDPDSLKSYKAPMEQLCVYNGKDCCVTRELYAHYKASLSDENLLKFYLERAASCFGPLLDLMCHGVAVDDRIRRKRLSDALKVCIGAETQIEALAGRPLHAKKSISSLKLLTWLKAQGVKIPRSKMTTGEYGESANETQLRKLSAKHPKIRPLVSLVLEHRRAKKLSEFLVEDRIDDDGRFRSSYKITTESGRLASAKNPMGTGANAQNLDREIRDVFVADLGCVLLEVDLSQAESRVVGMLTGDKELIEIAQTPPHQFDVHRYNASVIFGVEESEVTKIQRYLGKRAVHATNYGMAGKKLQEILFNEGYDLRVSDCDAMIRKYLDRFPAIERWHEATRIALFRTRTLRNWWGRRINFAFERMNEDLYRRGYAWVPQSDVADLMNAWGLNVLADCLRTDNRRSRINVHCHDALIVSCPVDEVFGVAGLLNVRLSEAREFAGGHTLAMPCEFKLGRSWKAEREWKILPAREEMEEAARAILA